MLLLRRKRIALNLKSPKFKLHRLSDTWLSLNFYENWSASSSDWYWLTDKLIVHHSSVICMRGLGQTSDDARHAARLDYIEA